MSDFSESSPNPNVPSIDDRLRAIQHTDSKYAGLDLRTFLDEQLVIAFGDDKDELTPYTPATVVGGSEEARSIVMDAFVRKLEEAAEQNADADKIAEAILPIHSNFSDPFPSVLEAMQRRTDDAENLFMVSDLFSLLIGNIDTPDRKINLSTLIEHPDYITVEVNAGRLPPYGISYEFFSAPLVDGQKPPLTDFVCFVEIDLVTPTEAPEAVSEKYPHFIRLNYREKEVNEEQTDRHSLDVPDDKVDLLSDLAKEMIGEAIVARAMDKFDRVAVNRELANVQAGIIVKDNPDPIEARKKLEEIGIYEDPENFR